MQVQGPYQQQWAPFQATGLLHAWQISHQIARCLYHEGWYLRATTLCDPSLSAASKSSWASQAHAFHQPVCQRLSWLHRWSDQCVHTSGAFSLSVWGSGLQCLAVQVAQWTWWWQCFVFIALSFRCRRWRLGFVNGQVSLAWNIALHIHKLYTQPRVLKERWQEERTGFSSLNFFFHTCCGWKLTTTGCWEHVS